MLLLARPTLLGNDQYGKVPKLLYYLDLSRIIESGHRVNNYLNQGLDLSIFITIIVLLLSTISIFIFYKINKYGIYKGSTDLFFILIVFGIVFWLAIYSVINLFFLLINNQFSIEYEFNSNILPLRFICVMISAKILLLIINNYQEDKLSYRPYYIFQLMLYSFAMLAIWQSLISGNKSYVTSVLIWLLIFIFDDWVIISDYIDSMKKIKKSHYYRVLLSNFMIIFLTMYIFIILSSDITFLSLIIYTIFSMLYMLISMALITDPMKNMYELVE